MNIKEAITKVLMEIPKGQRMPFALLIKDTQLMLKEAKALNNYPLWKESSIISNVINQGVVDGWLSNTQGRLGGYMLVSQMDNPGAHTNAFTNSGLRTQDQVVAEGNCKLCLL